MENLKGKREVNEAVFTSLLDKIYTNFAYDNLHYLALESTSNK